ncbi:hypothetical protein BH24CHL6_BH24CHL6_11880 [soil metagenome]
MNTINRLAVLLLVLTLLACGANPPSEGSPSPAAPTVGPGASPTLVPLPNPTVTPEPNATIVPVPNPTVSPEASPSPAGPSPAGPSPAGPSPAGPTPRPTVEPSRSPAPTAVAGSWSGPERISERAYGALSLVVDGQGMAHAAATLDEAIFYLTNSSGSWTRERITRPPQAQDEEDVGYVDREPSIAIDSDGTLWVAFTRMLDFENFGPYPEGVYVVTNRSGSWGNATRLATDTANSPSLKVRAGHIYLAYVDGRTSDAYDESATYAIRYGTDLGGSFTTSRVAAHGDAPQLELDSDGRPHILFLSGASLGSPDGVSHGAGAAPTGSFTVQRLPSTSGAERRPALTVDAAGRAHASWSLWPEGAANSDIYYARFSGGSWTAPERIMRDALHTALGADAAGAVHVAVGGDEGVWHLTDRAGSFQSERLSRRQLFSLDLAVDGGGRPHVLFMTGIDEGDVITDLQLWYGVGPAN